MFPEAAIQLCFWHAKRAIKAKLRERRKGGTICQYYPSQAQELVPDLEICWGSISDRRPDGPHRDGTCSCSHKLINYTERGDVEALSSEEIDVFLQMFARHYNLHPFIPDESGRQIKTADIHRKSTSEVYSWCRARGYHRLWAYMWVNWYRFEQWSIWARARMPHSIPVLKTTMIVESHWRRIKHDFLHRFSRPRIDFVVWIMTTKVFPISIRQAVAITERNHRVASSSWRRDFKSVWKRLAQKEVNPSQLRYYHTNPSSWTCSCTQYLLSRFLLCKHILHAYKSIKTPFIFFSEVRRARSPPFWRHQQLVLRDEFQLASSIAGDARDPNRSPGSSVSISDQHNDSDPECPDSWSEGSELDETGESGILNAPASPDRVEMDANLMAAGLNRLQAIADIYKEQMDAGNVRFCERVYNQTLGFGSLLSDIHAIRTARNMPTTWGRQRNSASIYYRAVER